MITIDDFKKIELKVGKILSAERVEGSEKLLKLMVDLGETDLPAGRQVLAGIALSYAPETLVGKQIVVVANLEPRQFTLRSIRQAQGRPEELEGRLSSGQVVLESQGMLLAAEGESGPVLIMPERQITPGAKIR